MKAISTYLKQRKEKRQLNKMIKEADRLFKATGKQHFVVPVVTRGVKSLFIMNNELHNLYNKKAKKMHAKVISYPELLAMAVYSTGTSTLKSR